MTNDEKRSRIFDHLWYSTGRRSTVKQVAKELSIDGFKVHDLTQHAWFERNGGEITIAMNRPERQPVSG